ncbi:MAG: methylamine utilization protein [Gammaproteobacteria bacterium]|nr:methylamine utilization protein [Gammaproteobacteria bacterium]NIR90627.1 methylamine utilization protein [Gammaproteobacteria bacterium]NIU07007.1 methylamine utilization protein [Gammaproteobacteria bacterium]NIX88280.1 methylamine utilization protein [Gammaproteobacteria bacterium]
MRASDDEGRPLADVVVSADRVGAGGRSKEAAPVNGERPTATIAQIDKQFVPYVTAIRVGTAVTFPNYDEILHNVYSFSRAKTFQLPLYKDTSPEPVVFGEPGVVVLGCNIHDWMVAYVYVLETPWFSKTTSEGRATLEVPPGEYLVEVRHPRRNRRASTPARELRLQEGARAELEFRVTLKPEWRPERKPERGR